MVGLSKSDQFLENGGSGSLSNYRGGDSSKVKVNVTVGFHLL